MKQRRLLGLVVILGLAAVLGVFVVQRYRARPVFAGGFDPILVSWSRRGGVFSLHGNLLAEYDPFDRVFLVVRSLPNESVEWVADPQPVSNWLRIRRQKDNAIRTIEWRRDCIVYVDEDGTPTYVSLPIQKLKKALSSPVGMEERVSNLINKLRPDAMR